MPRWIPEKIWDGQDVFIIGGGESLKTFDWNKLKDEYTIGCNDAFEHGEEICKICIFGDAPWFKTFKHKLALYKGAVFTNASSLQKTRLPWLWVMGRRSLGLHSDALGWNFNTGASAINLAILLGAKQIFLLGFDMHLSKDGKPNWHQNIVDRPKKEKYPKIYDKFIKGFERVASDLKTKFPNVKVFNITDNSSLDCFLKVSVKTFWEGRANKQSIGKVGVA